ncbi:MAG: XRE family transcriptional regulator [Chloroflexia bacterium]|nr:XRE family transcriptional regulator [Chloroflexia bacterium]
MIKSVTMNSALRVYLRELRIKQGITQQRAADAIGWTMRSFNEWETGKNEDIKSRHFIRLVVLLNASWNKIINLEINNSEDEVGSKMVNDEEQVKHEIDDKDIEELSQELWSNSKFRLAFLAFWAGWKAKELDS